MGYNASYDIKEVIDTFDKNSRGDKIRVSKVTNQGKNTVKVDVREMYTDLSGELQYGKVGIRLDSEIASDVIVAMLKALGQDTLQDILSRVTSE